MSNTSSWLAATLVVAAFGCGGVPKPEERLASSEGAIRGAKEAGAEGVPQATLHLKLAEEQRQHAIELIVNGDNHRADMLLARAEADAELAVALSREATAKAEAQKALDQVRGLKKRIGQ